MKLKSPSKKHNNFKKLDKKSSSWANLFGIQL